MPVKLNLDEKKIVKLYKNGKSLAEIGKIFNVASTTIMERLKKNNIKLRTLSEASEFKRNHCNITEELSNIISGLLLSDASMKGFKRSAIFHINMIYPNVINYLINIFNKYNIKNNKYTTKAYKRIYNGIMINAKKSYSFITMYYAEFLPIFFKWYKNSVLIKNKGRYVHGTKIVPVDIKLNPTVLYFWYIGDGCNEINSGRRRIQLCTHGFEKKYVELLVEKLKKYFNDNNNISLLRVNTKNYKNKEIGYYIYIGANLFDKFLDECLKADIDLPNYMYKFNRTIPNEIKLKRKKYCKEYRKNNMENENKRHRKYYQKNKEKIKKSTKKYQENNKEKIKAQRRKLYYEKKLEKQKDLK